jgi:hypothetical protein
VSSLMRSACLALLLLAAPLAAQPPGESKAPAIVFPEPPPSTPTPPAPPDPAAVARLTADELYVVTAEIPILLLASPQGLVTVQEQAGPVTIHARFVGGSGNFETKTFSAKHVFIVSAITTGRVEMLAVPTGATDARQVVRRTIDCLVGPRPPPGPDPPRPPDPADPFVAEVRVALAKESAEDRAKAAKLGEYYAWAATAAANHAGTNKQLWDAMVAKQRELNVVGGFPHVREVVGKRLLTVWPAQVDPAQVPPPDVRAAAARAFALAAQGVRP